MVGQNFGDSANWLYAGSDDSQEKRSLVISDTLNLYAVRLSARGWIFLESGSIAYPCFADPSWAALANIRWMRLQSSPLVKELTEVTDGEEMTLLRWAGNITGNPAMINVNARSNPKKAPCYKCSMASIATCVDGSRSTIWYIYLGWAGWAFV